MRIKTVLNRLRNDFWAVYECEACGATEKAHGYEDIHFHAHVIPNKVCQKCGASTKSLAEREELVSAPGAVG